jgi:hypothetical protein
MRYLILAYREARLWRGLPASERRRLEDLSLARGAALVIGGNLLAAGDLDRRQALTLRLQDGRPRFQDGPTDSSDTELVGYLLIEARDFNAAVRIVGGLPQAGAGPISIWRILNVDGTS